jgi:class 3 adenylate cyclase
VVMSLQNRITHENVNRPRPHQLSVRVGLHWGHVLTDGVQVTGDAVNLCARLVARSLPRGRARSDCHAICSRNSVWTCATCAGRSGR